MARNRILYIIAALGCLAFSMAYREKISAVLLAAMAVYPLLAAGTSFLLLALAKAEFSENTFTAEKGTRFELVINAINRFILPCVPMELVCALPDEDTGLISEKKIYVTLPPLGSAKLAMNCMNKYRGRYFFEVKKISVFDPLRIIRATKKGKSRVTAIFIPRKLRIPGAAALCGSESSSAKRQNAAEDREDFSHVRDYIPGEGIGLVHWKLTAKQDELMIKQFDSVNDRKALILCDLGGCSECADALLCADTVIETATAFALEFLDEKIFTTVDFGQIEGAACKISNRREFDDFYELASVIPAKEKVAPFLSLTEKAGTGGESVIVLITPVLSEEIITAANRLAGGEKVIIAFINLSGKILERDPAGERFILFNIKRSGQDELSGIARELFESSGE